jgi:inner membrane protein
MDNLTHTLTAIAISQTGLNRKTRFATATLILAANAPDIDILAGFRGSIAYLKYHRGITHSFVGIMVLAIVIWGLMCWIGKRVKPKPSLLLKPRWLLLAALLGTGSHLLLDFTNAYGVRPFLPFSERWYAWDIMFIFDPLLLALLILGLGGPWLLSLVSEEVGARKARLAPGAIFCLVAMVALWGIRDFAHHRTLSILDSRTYAGDVPLRFSALPAMVNPFTWMGVVETQTSFHVVNVNTLNANMMPEEVGTFEKPQPSPALAAAMKTRAGKVMLDFARFAWAQVEEGEEGYRVSLCDLRFYNESAQSRGFTLVMELDKNLQTLSESFYFAAPRGE